MSQHDVHILFITISRHSKVSALTVDNLIERILIVKTMAHRGYIWANFDMIR